MHRGVTREVYTEMDWEEEIFVLGVAADLTARKMGTDRLDQISRPPKPTLWPQTMLHHSF